MKTKLDYTFIDQMSLTGNLARMVTLNMNVAKLRDDIMNAFTEDSNTFQFLST